jgi:hypothetical protein
MASMPLSDYRYLPTNLGAISMFKSTSAPGLRLAIVKFPSENPPLGAEHATIVLGRDDIILLRQQLKQMLEIIFPE